MPRVTNLDEIQSGALDCFGEYLVGQEHNIVPPFPQRLAHPYERVGVAGAPQGLNQHPHMTDPTWLRDRRNTWQADGEPTS